MDNACRTQLGFYKVGECITVYGRFAADGRMLDFRCGNLKKIDWKGERVLLRTDDDERVELTFSAIYRVSSKVPDPIDEYRWLDFL
ncbi:hypothetical protein [Pseudomonas sp. R5(2019)]|uniref:hypothetical protein n=1 Tax=Pseudomonas sp. R5(2019) TaxID=2697566 RepID=UPI0014132DD0|nr:hypothetical protein [Pseudomonas sp. R5(2019)]NBA94161.1 hypothetical protein [Pseudomonas sp. R5(2019)]